MILKIQRGLAKQLHRPVTEPVFVVGTSDHCDMVLGDQQFPAIHFYMLKRDGRTILRPVASHPEITLNGRPQSTAATVTPGDRIRTGSFEFLVKAA